MNSEENKVCVCPTCKCSYEYDEEKEQVFEEAKQDKIKALSFGVMQTYADECGKEY